MFNLNEIRNQCTYRQKRPESDQSSQEITFLRLDQIKPMNKVTRGNNFEFFNKN